MNNFVPRTVEPHELFVADQGGENLNVIQAIDGQLAAAERQQIRETIAKLGRGGPRFLAVTQLPAVYDEDEFGSVEAVGKELLTRWLLPFEVTAMLLLIGIVGATVVAKRRA